MWDLVTAVSLNAHVSKWVRTATPLGGYRYSCFRENPTAPPLTPLVAPDRERRFRHHFRQCCDQSTRGSAFPCKRRAYAIVPFHVDVAADVQFPISVFVATCIGVKGACKMQQRIHEPAVL